MKSIVIFYSLLGHNKNNAEKISREEECDIFEFAPGNILRCFQFFFGHKKLKKKASKVDLSSYNSVIICSPIWAKKPAAAIKILLEMIEINEKAIKFYFTYTQDYGDTENFIRTLMNKKGADLLDIQFLNISKH